MTTTTTIATCRPYDLHSCGRSRSAVQQAIRSQWPAIVQHAREAGLPAPVARLAITSLPKGRLSLLGSSSKVEKGSEGFLVAVQYLSGALAHKVICPDSTVACVATCLGRNSGRLAHPKVGDGPQAWKTALVLGSPDAYRALLRIELRAFAAKAQRQGLISAIRLDGASDMGLASRFRGELIEAGIERVWDYTKRIGHAWNHLHDEYADVTLSYPGDRFAGAWIPWATFLVEGGRIAVVSADPMPKTWRGFPCVDGDSSDLRFLDPKGSVVWLTVKGSNRNKRRAESLGFTVKADG